MIERDDKGWGVRLTCYPFHGSGQKRTMRIHAEINKPKPRRSPEISIVFNAVRVQDPLRTVDVLTWKEALMAILAEARNVAKEMKAQSTKPRKTRRRTKKS